MKTKNRIALNTIHKCEIIKGILRGVSFDPKIGIPQNEINIMFEILNKALDRAYDQIEENNPAFN